MVADHRPSSDVLDSDVVAALGFKPTDELDRRAPEADVEPVDDGSQGTDWAGDKGLLNGGKIPVDSLTVEAPGSVEDTDTVEEWLEPNDAGVAAESLGDAAIDADVEAAELMDVLAGVDTELETDADDPIEAEEAKLEALEFSEPAGPAVEDPAVEELDDPTALEAEIEVAEPEAEVVAEEDAGFEVSDDVVEADVLETDDPETDDLDADAATLDDTDTGEVVAGDVVADEVTDEPAEAELWSDAEAGEASEADTAAEVAVEDVEIEDVDPEGFEVVDEAEIAVEVDAAVEEVDAETIDDTEVGDELDETLVADPVVAEVEPREEAFADSATLVDDGLRDEDPAVSDSGEPEAGVAEDSKGGTMAVPQATDTTQVPRYGAPADGSLFDVDTGIDLTDPAGPTVTPAVAPVAAPAAPTTTANRRTTVRSRKVRRVVRHIDPWSVLVMSVLMHLVLFTASLLAGRIVWNIAVEAGTIANIESFIAELGDYSEFTIDGRAVFRAAVMLSAVATLASSILVVLMSVVFNLLSDLVGGVRLTVVEEETVRLPHE